MTSVDLVWVGVSKPCSNAWTLGQVYAVEDSAVASFIEEYAISTPSEACLFWDHRLPLPHALVIEDMLTQPGDLWHAGLRFGLQAYPRLLQYVRPGWVLSQTAPLDRESTSWRVSFRACLVKTSVLKQVGGPYRTFETLEGAALEWGHRCVMQGVVARYIPRLLPQIADDAMVKEIPLEDEFRLLCYRHKRTWIRWAAARQILASPLRVFQTLGKYRKASRFIGDTAPKCAIYSRTSPSPSGLFPGISVILPTRYRYAYLENCLQSLREQTVPVEEIICVDQNPPEERKPDLYAKFSDLPLSVIWQNGRGQSLARNAALAEVKTDWIFFADDDSEYPPDTLEQHLRLIFATGADGSTGISLPPFEYTLPAEFRYARVASNFDTGNALVKTQAVLDAGGFDRNFDFGKGADSDLGMRLYLGGRLLMHNPEAKRLHHKAETGGLREYGVLWETKVKDRFQPWPSPTYLYWLMTYFPQNTWVETLIHSWLQRLSAGGASSGQRFGALCRELFLSPITIAQAFRSVRKARGLCVTGPILFAEKRHSQTLSANFRGEDCV